MQLAIKLVSTSMDHIIVPVHKGTDLLVMGIHVLVSRGMSVNLV